MTYSSFYTIPKVRIKNEARIPSWTLLVGELYAFKRSLVCIPSGTSQELMDLPTCLLSPLSTLSSPSCRTFSALAAVFILVLGTISGSYLQLPHFILFIASYYLSGLLFFMANTETSKNQLID